jgi:hypothetical protein
MNGEFKVRAAKWLLCVLGAAVLLPLELFAIEASNRYRSPRNPERKIRSSTELIVLHTTEAPARSSLNKLSDRGEAHYCVTEEGSVYRIIDRDKEAFHAGRSMWRGKEDVDKFSIGIECVGYHNKPMGAMQLAAIRDLVKELKAMYRLSDDRVVCHCHVAYGAPNKWHRCKHRGRKRCAMLFAMPSVRRFLDLKSRPAFDPDQRAGRLVQGDRYLQGVLYGRTDTMVGKVGGAPVNSQTAKKSWLGGIFSKSPPPSSTPSPKHAISSPVKTPSPRHTSSVQTAKSKPANIAQLKSGGWKLRGSVVKGVSASKLAGHKWNSPGTYYVTRGNLVPGDKINPTRLEAGTRVWTR